MRYVCLTVLLALSIASPGFAARDILLPSGVTVPPGEQVAFPVTLTQPAPSDGVFISLSSSDPSKVTVTPATVFIQQGATTTVYPVRVTGVGVGAASIAASAFNLTGDTEIVQVSSGAPSVSFSPTSVVIAGTGTQNVLLSLSTAAPTGGLFLNLRSDDPSVAQVQPTVGFFPDGSSQAIAVIAIHGVSAGTTVIRAGAPPNIAETTLTATVIGPGAITLPAGIMLTPNQSAAFPVALTAPAPAGGVTVSLTSSDATKVALSTASVFIPDGSSVPGAQPQVSAVGVGSATITASAPGYTGASQTVQSQSGQGAFSLSFSVASLTLTGTGTNSLQLNLSAPAPFGGLIVNLSSSNGNAVTVPPSVTLAANSTSVAVPVAGVAPGAATITASSNTPNVSSATASVVVSAPDIILPSGLSLLPGEQARIRVVLANPAPSGGVFITLSSGDPSKLTVYPATLFVQQGQTTSAVQPVLSGVNFGSVTLTAFAQGLTGDSETVRVGATLGFSPSSLAIVGTGVTSSLVLNLAVPAPAGGLTVALSSSNAMVATVPASVTFPANVSSLLVPVTSVGQGSAVIHASAPPNLPDSAATVTVLTSATIALSPVTSIATGQTLPLAVALGLPAPAGGVNVTLSSSNISTVVVSPATIFLPEGATTPLNQPLLTAFNIGTVAITASAPGYATAAQNVQATAAVTFSPNAVTIPGGTSGRVLLSLSSSAPPGTTQAGRCESPNPASCSITVGMSSDNQSVAWVQSSVSFFPDGSSQAIAQIFINAVAPGTTTIHAGAPPYIPDTTLIVTVR